MTLAPRLNSQSTSQYIEYNYRGHANSKYSYTDIATVVPMYMFNGTKANKMFTQRMQMLT